MQQEILIKSLSSMPLMCDNQMASDVVRGYDERLLGNQHSPTVYGGEVPPSEVRPLTTETFIKSPEQNNHNGSRFQRSNVEPVSSSSYTLASDSSQYSRDVDLWLRGSNTESTGVQNSRVATAQRSTIAPSPSLDGMWYIIAMILPMFSANNTHWRCTPSTVLNAAEFFLNQFSRFCAHARTQIRRLAGDQIARDLFATAMDIVLVVYAIGFLALSLYQASIIG
ncbi:unnamed protein product [Spodoptera exigua]|nr:unnamed protein product [Spodoptera exigua]